MNSLFPRASLKRSPRTRTRKNSISVDMDTDCAHSLASSLVPRKTRPPPLQIIAELSENEQNFDTHSPATARPFQFVPQRASRITLSAYTFSIDDTLLIFGDDAPGSPALSASSSTSDGASSEDVLATPGVSDGEDEHDFILATPRLHPERVPVRPLCIMKTRSLVYKEDEDIHNCLESHDNEDIVTLPVTGEQPRHITQFQVATELAQESEQDFYVREFEDFITLSPVVPFVSSPARRDSLTLVVEALPIATIPSSKPRGRSRHSKPLPLLPPVTPPISSFPFIPTFPLVQTTAQSSVVRRRRNIPSHPTCPPPPLPAESRPLPRMSIPLDIDDSLFPEEKISGPIVVQPVYSTDEDTSISSPPSFAYTVCASTHPFRLAAPETSVSAMYGDVILPRSSTDSNAPRSSIDSDSSFTSSTSSNRSASPFRSSLSGEDDETECTQRLRSRWSSSTLGSLALEPSRTTTLLSPIKSALHARMCRAAPQAQKVPSKIPSFVTPPRLPKNKRGSSSAPSPPSIQSRHVRQQGSRSSTSSSGSSSAEPTNHEGSPVGLKRKPIPMLMFLRST